MKKRMMALLLVVAMIAAMVVGCGKKDDKTSSNDGNKVYKIGICQLVEHPALDAATEGFKAALVELIGKDNVEFDFQNAAGEQSNATTIVNAFVASKVDLIMANATSPLQQAASATASIPILGTSITDYASALEIKDWAGVTGRNISGTSDLAPLDEQEKMLVELFPNVKKVGIVYTSSETNSVYQAKKFAEYLKADGVAYEEYKIADSNEIQTVVTAAVQDCDVLYIPTDNVLASYAETVKNIVVPAGVPVIAGEEGICAGCGVATLSISYYDLGYTTGKMAYEILVNGASIESMEIQYAPNVTKKYNEELCNALNVTIPEGYEKIQ